MPTIDLKTAVPEILAETASLDDLLAAVKGIEAWDDRQAEILDHAYRFRTAKLLRAADAESEILELITHLDRVAHPRRTAALDGLEKPYASRWRAYVDLLDARLHALQSPAPAMVMRRAHVEKILDLVVRGEVSNRKELKEKIRLRDANLTRLLNLMEANELIERRAVGREKKILPGAKAGIARQGPKAASAPMVERGLSYFRLDSAA